MQQPNDPKTWLSPLKQRFLDLDEEVKKEEKLFAEMAALISYQHNLANRLVALLVSFKSEELESAHLPYNIQSNENTALVDQSQTVFTISDKFSQTLLKYVESNRLHGITGNLATAHGIFLTFLKTRNAYFLDNISLLPPFPRTQKIAINFGPEPLLPQEHNQYTLAIQKSLIMHESQDKKKTFCKEFIPTTDVISHIFRNKKDLPFPDRLQAIYESLKKTHTELVNENTELNKQFRTYEDYIAHLPFSVVRDAKQYKEYVMGIKQLTAQVRVAATRVTDPMARIMETLKSLNLLLLSASSIGRVDMAELHNLGGIYIERALILNRLQLFEELVQRAGIKPLARSEADACIATEREFLETALHKLQAGEYGDLMEAAEKAFDHLLQAADALSQEAVEKRNAINDFEAGMQRGAMAQAPPDANISYQVRMLTESVDRRRRVNSERTGEALGKMRAAIEHFAFVADSVHLTPPLPPNAHETLEALSDRGAAVTATSAHLGDLRERIEARKKAVAEKRAQLEKTRAEIEKKHEELKELAEAKRTQQPVKTRIMDEFKEFEEKYQCPLCMREQRTKYITVCGHTFCKTCIDNQIRTRNRKCPVCAQQIRPSQVHAINWK